MHLGRLLLVFLALNGLFCIACSVAGAEEHAAEAYRGKKILWINSYHEGYPWGDGIGRGIRKVLSGTDIDLKVWYMDTLRNRSEAYGQKAGRLAKRVIEEYRPDVLIASDDNAQKFLVVPYLKGNELPVIFCGVNRQPAEYGYPASNVTGMHEVDFVGDLVSQMRAFAGGDRLGMIACKRETDKAIAEAYNHYVFGGRLKVYLVENLAEFKETFLRAQQEVDILCLPNNAGIEGWEDDVVEKFLLEHTRIPTGGLNPWMKPFVIFNLAKIPEEQGEYVATTALRILAGERPEDIPVTQNRHATLTVNLKMAQATGIVLPVSLLQTAEIIGRETLRD